MSMDSARVWPAFKQAGIISIYTSQTLNSLVGFTKRMLELNKILNLTRYTQEEDVIQFHLLDSAQALEPTRNLMSHTPFPRVLDLGSGCGFPGMVFATAFPTWEVTLLDAVAKKAKALEECIKSTQIQVKILCVRAEKLGKDPTTRETWDVVLARAVGDFSVVLEYALPLLKTGGYFVDWITAEQLKTVDKSKKAISLLGGKLLQNVEYFLPSRKLSRWLIFVEKVGKTPSSYPRSVGIPKKRPL